MDKLKLEERVICDFDQIAKINELVDAVSTLATIVKDVAHDLGYENRAGQKTIIYRLDNLENHKHEYDHYTNHREGKMSPSKTSAPVYDAKKIIDEGVKKAQEHINKMEFGEPDYNSLCKQTVESHNRIMVEKIKQEELNNLKSAVKEAYDLANNPDIDEVDRFIEIATLLKPFVNGGSDD